MARIWIVRLFMAPLAAVIFLAGCGADSVSQQQSPTRVGQGAEPAGPLAFEGTTLDGTTFSGATLSGKAAVLWFWAPWCVICRAEAPGIAEIASRFDGRVAFVGVPDLGKVADMQRFVDDAGVGGFPQVVDGDGSVWASFGVISQPAFAFIRPGGEIEVVVGSVPEAELAAKVEALAP